MDRSTFVRLMAAGTAGLSAAPLWASAASLVGTTTTQEELFGTLPPIRPKQFTRIILGTGVKYQKQIGAGVETDPTLGKLAFLETQIGSPGGSCNPSSMRKAYLEQDRFGSLMTVYPLRVNIGRVENMFYRFGDMADAPHQVTGDDRLHLLDEKVLYDPRPLRIESVTPDSVKLASGTVVATKFVGVFATPPSSKQLLRRIELWSHPAFPFGFAKYRATIAGVGTFGAETYSHGDDFESLLSYSLDRVRSMTQNGSYGQLPQGVGA